MLFIVSLQALDSLVPLPHPVKAFNPAGNVGVGVGVGVAVAVGVGVIHVQDETL